MTSKEYKALKNYLHNAQEVTRWDLRSMVRDAVREIVRDEVTRFLQTNEFRNFLAKQTMLAMQNRYQGLGLELQQAVLAEIRNVAAEWVRQSLDLTIRLKPSSATTEEKACPQKPD